MWVFGHHLKILKKGSDLLKKAEDGEILGILLLQQHYKASHCLIPSEALLLAFVWTEPRALGGES